MSVRNVTKPARAWEQLNNHIWKTEALLNRSEEGHRALVRRGIEELGLKVEGSRRAKALLGGRASFDQIREPGQA